MPVLDSLKKAVVGDPANETIKAGTLATTRGIGVIAVGLIGVFLLMDQFETGPWKDLDSAAQLRFVLAAGAIWAVVASADAIARALAATSGKPSVTALPPGLVATRTAGVDSPGWHIAAVETGGSKSTDTVRFLVVKGDEIAWVAADDLFFPALVPQRRGVRRLRRHKPAAGQQRPDHPPSPQPGR